MRVSDKVRSGPRGSGRARVVEFSYYATVDAVAVDVAAAVMTNVTEMMTVVWHAWQLVVTEQVVN